MKSQSRSHRLPISDPPDDWVDGSWTVDCVCGVNFDDGEEMVNCDECGVWVHTRCSRYVKSEKLFACDKCKSKNNSRNDSEETEVAQLLVELPTKTLRMGNPNPNPPSGPPQRPFRLWTDIPMEERVHVQGIPGGDPTLFGGFSSVFSPELWKCTGYVPKKFNFQYKEFSCWDEKQEDDKKTDGGNNIVAREETENPANKGAGVLFSLSKENVLPTHSTTLVGTKRQVEESGCDRLAPSGDTKMLEGEDLEVRSPQNGVKKDMSLLRPIVIHSGKRKKEDTQTSKDRSGKKKARSVHVEGDSKKRNAHASKSVSTLSSHAKQLEFYEDRGPKVHKNVTQSNEQGNSEGTVPADLSSEGFCVVENKVGDSKNNLAFSVQISETLSCDLSTHRCSIEAKPKEENGGQQITARLEISPKFYDGVQSSLKHNDSESVPVKEKVVGDALDNLNDIGGASSRSEGIDPHKPEPLVEDLANAAPQVKDSQNDQDSNGHMSLSSLHRVKAEVDILNSGGVFDVQSSPCDVKLDDTEALSRHPGITADLLSENVKENDAAIDNSQSIDHKVEDVGKSTVVADCQIDKADEAPCEPCQPKRQLVGSESSMIVRKSSSELKQGLRPTEEPSRSGGAILSPSEPPSQRKMVVSFGKSSSISSTILISKSSGSDSRRPPDSQNYKFSHKQRGMSEYNVSNKKDNASADVVNDRDGHERPKKIAKELPKSSVISVKTSHSSKFPHASASRRTLSESKESSKASSVQNFAAIPSSIESASSLQTESVLNVENKITASVLPQRSEKINHLNCQTSAKVNHTPQMHPPAPLNSPATLSDEELALLLHQELNSSPRVPRVPRMRHAGSLPQLASPTGTSMLMKRTSSSGGKDNGLVSKRKGKDLAQEGSRNSHELEDESKKVDRSPLLPDQRRHDLARTADPATKGEADNGSAKGVHSVNKSISRASSLTAGSGSLASAEANEQNMSSTRNSPRNASDDDTGNVVRPTHRTLPGLISDIMSKGKRMTYEELCNAVLPHWPNLRKHNGERYAYSSHSQAVLDCLRNRSEWARLVDRGPKNNAGRKRRKFDAEAPSFESEDNGSNKDRTAKDIESKSFESHRDEFPKGKRKARKRRRLALQGRGIKDVRRRHKAGVLSDDDIGSLSNSSEESMFSEDEIQGGGTCPGRCEASASSDEAGTML